MECRMCGSIVNPNSPICNVCGSPINQINSNRNMNINPNINNNYNPNINNQYNMRGICYDFICPHCGLRIPENQLYQFIHRPQPLPTNINQNMGFNNMSGINSQINPNQYNNNNNNSLISSIPSSNNQGIN